MIISYFRRMTNFDLCDIIINNYVILSKDYKFGFG